MNVMMLDRKFLVFVFQNLDPQFIRGNHRGLIRSAIATGQYRDSGGLPPGSGLLNVLDNESHMVDHRSHGAAHPSLAPSHGPHVVGSDGGHAGQLPDVLRLGHRHQ